MGNIATTEILDFLKRLGERYPRPATLFLMGGSALCLLGNPRRTLDIDYIAEAPPAEANELHAAIETLASEMKLEIEAVPLGEFIPLPDDVSARHRLVGQFGKLTVYVYDPYSIALSKVARGFETDLQDVLFLLRQNVIALGELKRFVEAVLPRARDFDIAPDELRLHMAEVRRLYQSQ